MNAGRNSVREVSSIPEIAAVKTSRSGGVLRGIKEAWRDYLDRLAPPGLSSRGVDNINDAYRHYMSAAEFTRAFGPDVTYTLGDLNEKINSAYSSESTQMDYANNDAGIEAGKTSRSGVESSLAFIRDLAQGKIKVIDPSTGEVRDATIRDLPAVHSGDAVEDRYRPDRGTDPLGSGDGETMIA